MNRVQPIYDITVHIQELLKAEITTQNRPKVIEEINSLLNQRGLQMENISEPFTKEELELGKKLLPLNEQIQRSMDQLFNGLKSEMKAVKKQKNSNRKYTNPYEKVHTVDGMFMDKRK
ncbi:flagellar protein FliT [Ornithinibacillus scapharcae]|uniref:flagellar protein FliT n=1 Tax=Ornithinibacillus scapharcae TaxID=1147159 RepID=UPI000225B13D|nr:flagellar protein FliT [Ornithinibacillus scapharcae]